MSRDPNTAPSNVSERLLVISIGANVLDAHNLETRVHIIKGRVVLTPLPVQRNHDVLMLTKMEAEQGPKYLKAAKKIPRVSSVKPQTVNHISQTVDVSNLLNYKYIFKFYQAEILAVTGGEDGRFQPPFHFYPNYAALSKS